MGVQFVAKNPVGWFEIYVDDMARAKAFYETVLGIFLESLTDPTEDNFEMLGFPSAMDEYGSSGALLYTETVKAGGNSTVVYFSCDDCAVEEARIEKAGGKVLRPKMSIGQYGFVTMAQDSEGNNIGLHSMT